MSAVVVASHTDWCPSLSQRVFLLRDTEMPPLRPPPYALFALPLSLEVLGQPCSGRWVAVHALAFVLGQSLCRNVILVECGDALSQASHCSELQEQASVWMHQDVRLLIGNCIRHLDLGGVLTWGST